MCGICGLVYSDRQRRPDPANLAAMNNCLERRGPDAEGFHIQPGVGLGHRRLSVIDLESGGQPMSDPSGQITIVFNGEIYNFQSIRSELTGLGHVFKTTSDTEVLLAGFLQWGECVVDRLAGMFAFAIWDARNESLLIARDRLGVKPLYWTRLPDGGLAFASELSSLVVCSENGPRLNLEAAAKYVCLGYVSGTPSILAGCERLPPGHTLLWRRGREPQVKCYWNLADVWSKRPRDERPEQEIQEEFRDLLDTAVKERLISDVPLGAFLSGGLDSSTIAALMLRHKPSVETFSIGFREASYSELPYARQVAERLGTKHFDQVLDASIPELLMEISSRQDEPFADTSIIPTYVLCRMARERVTVALSGDGGDELLAGYVTHVANSFHRMVSRFPTAVTALAGGIVELLPASRRKVNMVFKAKKFFAGRGLSECDAHASWRMLADQDQVRRMFSRSFESAEADPWGAFRTAYQEAKKLGPLDRLLYVDYKTWLVDDILVKVDRASMSHGLEVRSPFLDYRLIEFCASVPEQMKLHGRKGKYLLRQFAADVVPPVAIKRRKVGFNAPVSHWLVGPWKSLAMQAFDPAHLRSVGLLDPDVVGRLYAEHLSGRQDHGYLLFTLLMLCLWLERVKPSLG